MQSEILAKHYNQVVFIPERKHGCVLDVLWIHCII